MEKTHKSIRNHFLYQSIALLNKSYLCTSSNPKNQYFSLAAELPAGNHDENHLYFSRDMCQLSVYLNDKDTVLT